MNKQVAHQLQHIDTKLNALIADLKKYSDEKLNHKPTPDTWSVVEVLQHVMLVEGASQRYVQKKLSYNPSLKNANIFTSLRIGFTRIYNLMPIKLKAPAYVDERNFSSDIAVNELITNWKSQRQQLRDYLTTLPEAIFKKEVYKNPVAGRLSLYGMLQFFEGHFDRHYKQIQNLLKSSL